jgi:predicted DNA-binding transcriptional regulator YafY
MQQQTRFATERMHAIDRALRGKGFPNCTRLAAELGTSSRTIRRDIHYMQLMLKAPIAYDQKRRGFYYKEEWLFFPSSYFNELDAESLLATRAVLAQYEGAPYYADICNALDKVLRNVPATRAGQHLLDVYSFAQPALPLPDPELFRVLEGAIRKRLKVRFRYESLRSGAESERTVHPYRLHLAEDAWYLVAVCELRKGPRLFILRNIRDIGVLDTCYRPDGQFDIDGYLQKRMFLFIEGGGRHTVRIWFSARFADYIRQRRWHPAQELTVNADGSLLLSMVVDAYDVVACWIMQFGSGAEVLEPAELRRRIVRESRAIEGIYGDNGRVRQYAMQAAEPESHGG